MIFGFRAFFILSLLLATVPAHAEWDLDALSRALAAQTAARLDFREERHVSYLTENLVLSGYVARKGERLEKHVLAPITESFVIEGDQIEVETAKGDHYILDLEDHPMMQGVAMALRAGLSGDFTRLHGTFNIREEGDAAGWTLHLVPHTEKLREVLREVTLSGAAGKINRIRIEGVDGDTSVMHLGATQQ